MTKTVTVNIQFTEDELRTLHDVTGILYEISRFYENTVGDTEE